MKTSRNDQNAPLPMFQALLPQSGAGAVAQPLPWTTGAASPCRQDINSQAFKKAAAQSQ